MALAVEQIAPREFTARAEGEGDHPSSLPDIGLSGYWKKPNGEIVLLDSGPNGMQAYTRKRWMLLPEYGQWSLSPQRGWQPMTDPYRKILEFGGIREFTREQIVELHWHTRPHPVLQRKIDVFVQSGMDKRAALDAVIPQLAGYEWEVFRCGNPACRDRAFNSESELRGHEVLHREDVRTREMSNAISTAISGSQAANMESLAPALTAIAEVVQSLAVSQVEMQKNFNALLAEVAKSNKSSK
jgi:hypothetical protein